MPDESDETKSDVYFLYNKKQSLNETDPFMSGQDTAFAVKDAESMEHYAIFLRGRHNKLTEVNTLDPRAYMEDHLENANLRDFHMFNFSIALSSSQEAVFKSILNECVSGEAWPGNVLTKMESSKLLTREQKENAVANRRNFVDR
jgi:hypothetical protein